MLLAVRTDGSQASTKPSTATPWDGHYKPKRGSTAHLHSSPCWGFPCLSPGQRDGCVATWAWHGQGAVEDHFKPLYKITAFLFCFLSNIQLNILMLLVLDFFCLFYTKIFLLLFFFVQKCSQCIPRIHLLQKFLMRTLPTKML